MSITEKDPTRFIPWKLAGEFRKEFQEGVYKNLRMGYAFIMFLDKHKNILVPLKDRINLQMQRDDLRVKIYIYRHTDWRI